jgi:hypothetical protein
VHLLDGSGIVGTRAVLVGDDAIATGSAPAVEIDGALRRSGLGSDRYVVAHLRDAPYVGGVDLSRLVRAIDEYALSVDAEVICLAINDNAPSEASLFSRVVDSGVEAPWHPLDVAGRDGLAVGVLGGAHSTISHSYHAALWSLANGTPGLLVTGSDYYQRKAAGLAGLFGVAGGVGLEPDADAVAIAAHLQRIERSLDPAIVDGVRARVDGWLRSVVPTRVVQ